MAAGDTLFACRSAKHPTAAIAGVTHAGINPATVAAMNQGAAGATGRADTLITDRAIGADLFAIDVVYCLRSVDYGGAIEALFARITPRTVFKTNQGAAGSPGPVEFLVTNYELFVEVWGKKHSDIIGMLGNTAATLTLGIEGAAGADQTVALTNVYFSDSLGTIDLPAKDAGGTLSAYGVGGFVHFGAGEVFADVITATPTNFTAALAKVGAAAANLVLGTEGAAGANEKLTLKNAKFVQPIGALQLPAKDVGGPLQPFGVQALCEWGATDTFALMLTAAADT